MPERADHRQPAGHLRRRAPRRRRGAACARPAGFSLIETLFALAIAAVLLGLAMPSLRDLSGDSQTSATVNAMVFALQSARSEAIKRAGVVTLCASAAPLSEGAACDGADFGDGWIVFADTDGDGERANAERPILQDEARSSAFTFPADESADWRVSFGDTGASVSAIGTPRRVTIALVHASGERRTITVAANGRVASEAP